MQPWLPSAGSHTAGSPFLCTELLPLGSLRALLRRAGPLSPDQQRAFLLDAARGMEHLHSLGRIHRDLKTGIDMVSLSQMAFIQPLPSHTSSYVSRTSLA